MKKVKEKGMKLIDKICIVNKCYSFEINRKTVFDWFELNNIRWEKQKNGDIQINKKGMGSFSLLYQSLVSIQGPVGYGPTTLPLRHSDLMVFIFGKLYIYLFFKMCYFVGFGGHSSRRMVMRWFGCFLLCVKWCVW